MEDILDTLLSVRVKTHEGSYRPNKPLLLLVALTRCQQGKERLAPFHIYEESLALLSPEFGSLNAVFPFGRLPSDGVWEISAYAQLDRNSSGDLLRSELLNRSVRGGFPQAIYEALSTDHELLIAASVGLLKKYIPPDRHSLITSKFGLLLPETHCKISQEDHSCAHSQYNSVSVDFAEAKMAKTRGVAPINGFISYLNSLHNLESSGANALAESQATSPYFGELYAPFPLIDKLAEALTDGVPRIVVLTGHAGDGKSTVALDVLRKLRGLHPTAPLGQPMKERENIDAALVSIVKDMSELSAERRQQWLHEAFNKPGSWLIISNTGPLLSSLKDYAKFAGIDQGIENAILNRLDRPLDGTCLDTHTLDGFKKKLVILNLTRWNNLELVEGILSRLVNHSGWGQCAGCSAEPACPLMLNRKALRDAGTVAGERVRWIYQRLGAYEQRLTLRQIVAQLAIGLTAGMSCDEAFQVVAESTAEGVDRGSKGLEQILFSESFFGYRGGKPWSQAEGLHAVALVRRATFGGPVAVDFERRLPADAGQGWAHLPPSLDSLANRWRQGAADSSGVRWRFALRRMVYLFGTVVPGKDKSAAIFLDAFLQSPSLRELDHWQTAGNLTLSRGENKRLRTACLRVLLEVFSGFSSGQFQLQHDTLYLTLRRPDRAEVQPTQLVIETLRFEDFGLRFDRVRGLLLLGFDKGRAELPLSLPLLDYIRRRDAGELGNALSPIHQAQLDCFRAKLLRVTAETRHSDDEIALLRSGIDGGVHLHRFFLDRDQHILEQN